MGRTRQAALGIATLVLAAQLAAGCTLTVSHRCQATSDCLGGECIAGICQSRPNGDSSASETPANAGGGDSRSEEQQDVSSDPASAESSADAGDAGSEADADAASADADASLVDAPVETGDVRRQPSACPAWADWPMPAPPSLTGHASVPELNLPNPQSYDTTDPDVVVDLVTHLVWQKTPSPDFMIWPDADSYCANLALGGRDDWRLPSRIELVSLIDETEIAVGYVNPDAFPDNPQELTWACTPGPANPLIAWLVDFSDGATGSNDKLAWTGRVRCVAGMGAATPPPDRYDLTHPGEVRDLRTLLTWTAAMSPQPLTWGDGLGYCGSLGAGWRLPTLTEIQTLLDETRGISAVSAAAFPDWSDQYYWTSSYHKATSFAWFGSIGAGNTWWQPTNYSAFVRCVR